jgi:hypothetical protein
MQHKKLQANIESEKIHINQKGGGRKPRLEIKEQVCLCLFYFYYWLEILGNVLPASPLEQVKKHDSDYGIPTHKKRHKTKSFPKRVFLLNTSLDL